MQMTDDFKKTNANFEYKVFKNECLEATVYNRMNKAEKHLKSSKYIKM